MKKFLIILVCLSIQSCDSKYDRVNRIDSQTYSTYNGKSITSIVSADDNVLVVTFTTGESISFYTQGSPIYSLPK